MPYVFKVVKEGVKTVSITRLDTAGEVVNPDKSKDIRKSSIIAILKSLDDYQHIREMNSELNAAFTTYCNLKHIHGDKIAKMKAEFQSGNQEII